MLSCKPSLRRWGVKPVEQLRLHTSDLIHLWPELTLVIAAVALSLLDLALPERMNRTFIGWLTLASLLVSGVFVAMQLHLDVPVELLAGSYRVDDFANLLKLVFLLGTSFVVLMSVGTIKQAGIAHVGEYYYFLLPATLGAMVMASSADMITLYVGLELLSITSYIMVAMRKKSSNSNEGAFKYLVMGGISSAMILYGMSFLYGISGATNLAAVKDGIYANFTSFEALIYVAFFFLIAGLGFKIAAAPFHSWAPDVYEGAPTPISAFLAVVSKGAAFAILFRIIYNLFIPLPQDGPTGVLVSDVFLTLGVVAAMAMIVGNVIALRQTNAKRLLAYSGIANAGYLLVPLATQFSTAHYSNFAEFTFYLIAYLFMNIGAFAVIILIEKSSGSEEIRGFAGLYYRAPFTAVAMTLLVLSLAGIPITGGFFGKLFILLGTMETHHYWLGAIMLITSVISFYYYFGIVRQMYMRSDYESAPLQVPGTVGFTVWLCAIVTVLLGIFPHVLLQYIDTVFTITKDLLFVS
ncbi:NADH-quinone oxidoreductase subunit N [Paenibacillus sp. N1-5-1-14]|uniref:NADH-quinone oxidoreductase subunit N n=1 Tax=Paenibacillus radicibacter TaxID=2972488 RepID=UPI002158B55E|nr:NADH-quinone oxidoreductase subunit N [Paenibacillus radicibacter]MCR8645078.1 NADH-quinone oxidoreductase subunit N [Paenibacillus radicibacter]